MLRPYFISPLAFRQFLANLKAAPRELPDEDDPLVIRLEAKLRKHFRAQHRVVLASLGRKKAPLDLPDSFIPLDSWDREMFVDARPIIELWMSRSSGEFLTRIGASPEVWAVVSPKLREAVDSLTLTFCQATNDTTSQNLSDALAKLREEIDSNLFKGQPLPELTKRVNRIFDGAETWRAKRIAWTEASRSVHRAEYLAGQESGVASGTTWIASADACDFCRSLNGKTVPYGTPFAVVQSKFPDYANILHAPAHPHCLLPETAVWPSAWVAGIKASYDGPIVRLYLSDGSNIAVTPNHMLLTPGGFWRATDLMKGQDILRYCVDKPKSCCDPNNDWKPTPVEQVVDSWAKTLSVTTSIVPVASEYLHGDAAFCDGNIDVVAPNGFLRRYFDTQASQPSCKRDFIRACNLSFSFDSKSHFATVLFALRDATDGGVAGRRELAAFIRGQARHAQQLTFAATSGSYTGIKQRATNERPTDIKSLGQRLLRFASVIARDEFLHWQTQRAGSAVCGKKSTDGHAATNKTILDGMPTDAQRACNSLSILASLVALYDLSDGQGLCERKRDRSFLSANFATSFSQNPADNLVMEANRIRNCVSRFPSAIATCKVLAVATDYFRGHVYDLQTESSLSIIGNGIISSNCNCTTNAVIDEAALAPGISMDELLRARRELVGAGV